MLLASALVSVSGCHRAPAPVNSTANNGVKQYHIRGVVVATNTANGVVTVSTEAIPGFMPPMIMPYKLENPGVASGLHPGDTITAELLASKDSDLLDQVVIVGQAKLNSLPKVQYKPLVPGESVPNFSFLNQSNRIIHIDQFRGKVLLMTFIYTRCPLSTYCPRMSRNFAEINTTLSTEPKLYARTHLLSVSFDPSYDTPSVLRSYGGAYTGKYTQETFQHWDFAAPPEKELSRVLQFFLVGVTPEKNHVLAHSLSTVVITPQGKIYKWYPTNTWTPQQLLANVNTLLKNKTPS
ncbi:MAG TPA: SCO family protein [Acidobacteriaceae bacterium]|nr:SCO family protein [Acidobacteriaceae bacterium]